MEEKEITTPVEEINENAQPENKSKSDYKTSFKKYLNIGLCVLAAIFASLAQILNLAFITGASTSVYIAGGWMDFIALGFAVASAVLQCYQFVKNRKFQFSPEVYINLLAFLIILI